VIISGSLITPASRSSSRRTLSQLVFARIQFPAFLLTDHVSLLQLEHRADSRLELTIHMEDGPCVNVVYQERLDVLGWEGLAVILSCSFIVNEKSGEFML
jgi:hypothetical protein